jgi:hypothetical protein
MSDLTLDQVRLRLEQRTDPWARSLLDRLKGSVHAFWDAESAYVDRLQLLDLLREVDTAGTIVGQPGRMRLAAEELGAEQFMFNTKADLRTILDAIARLEPAAPELVQLGEQILDVWTDAEGELGAEDGA